MVIETSREAHSLRLLDVAMAACDEIFDSMFFLSLFANWRI